MNPLEFEYTLDSSAGGAIKIPHDVRSLFGRAKPAVLVTVRGGAEHTYRSTVAVYGGEYYVPLNKANATTAAITGGEPFRVRVVSDDQPRVVHVPEDLAAALDASGLRDRWDRLSFSRQRERADAIEEAKHAETRERRIRATVEQLSV